LLLVAVAVDQLDPILLAAAVEVLVDLELEFFQFLLHLTLLSSAPEVMAAVGQFHYQRHVEFPEIHQVHFLYHLPEVVEVVDKIHQDQQRQLFLEVLVEVVNRQV
jgi:hypothetical protein